jgi:hypothetical protein
MTGKWLGCVIRPALVAAWLAGCDGQKRANTR